MNSNDLRKALIKIMPGYKWTIHRSPGIYKEAGVYCLSATGIRSSGFNRLSTLSVVRREEDGEVEYEAKSSGYGKRAPWLYAFNDKTLARALRGLQNHYEAMAQNYSRHAKDLENGRKPTDQQKGA